MPTAAVHCVLQTSTHRITLSTIAIQPCCSQNLFCPYHALFPVYWLHPIPDAHHSLKTTKSMHLRRPPWTSPYFTLPWSSARARGTPSSPGTPFHMRSLPCLATWSFLGWAATPTTPIAPSHSFPRHACWKGRRRYGTGREGMRGSSSLWRCCCQGLRAEYAMSPGVGALCTKRCTWNCTSSGRKADRARTAKVPPQH